MSGDIVRILISADLVDKLEERLLTTRMTDNRLLGMHELAERAIGTEADWTKLVADGRAVHLQQDPTYGHSAERTSVKCECCPGSCRNTLRWRGITRCACTPDRVRGVA